MVLHVPSRCHCPLKSVLVLYPHRCNQFQHTPKSNTLHRRFTYACLREIPRVSAEISRSERLQEFMPSFLSNLAFIVISDIPVAGNTAGH
jgi:hypothetical protein